MPLYDEEDEERLLENNSSATRTTTISELPGKPFRVTVELPIFLTVMGISLIGAYISLKLFCVMSFTT